MTLTQRLDAITARLKAATPGPWMTGDCMDCPGDVYSNEPDGHCLVVDNSTVQNAELIANAPADLTFTTAALREALGTLNALLDGSDHERRSDPDIVLIRQTIANIQRLAGEV